MKYKKLITLLLILLLTVVVLGVSCSVTGPTGTEVRTANNFKYVVVEDIEGMTCIWVFDTIIGPSAYAGLTCNWEEYNG